MKAKLLGTGRALPGDEIAGVSLDNHTLAALMGEVRERLAHEAPELQVLPTDPDFPERRLGVKRRRILDEGLTVRDLAVVAARGALEDSGVAPASIGAVFVNTTTPAALSPVTACIVHDALGLGEDIAAFDQALGCNGFIGGLYSAEGAVGRNPDRPNVLVVAAEAMSWICDASDRTTMPIFGDGAGAAIFGPPEDQGAPGVWMATQGSSAERITVDPVPGEHPVYRIRCRDGEPFVAPDRSIRYSAAMQGQQVFKDMIRMLPPRIEAYCERAGVPTVEIDQFLFHQANTRMIEGFAERLLGDDYRERTPMHIQELGNTSSASVAILLDQVRKEGKLGPGKRALLCAFGTGYSLGMTLVEG